MSYSYLLLDSCDYLHTICSKRGMQKILCLEWRGRILSFDSPLRRVVIEDPVIARVNFSSENPESPGSLLATIPVWSWKGKYVLPESCFDDLLKQQKPAFFSIFL